MKLQSLEEDSDNDDDNDDDNKDDDGGDNDGGVMMMIIMMVMMMMVMMMIMLMIRMMVVMMRTTILKSGNVGDYTGITYDPQRGLFFFRQPNKLRMYIEESYQILRSSCNSLVIADYGSDSVKKS